MSTHKASSSRVLFLEIVLDLVIFVIVAIICLQIFAEARHEADRSAAITRLGIEAQEVAELFKSGQGAAEELADKTNAENDGDGLVWYYDQKLNVVQSDKAYFVMTCVIDDSQPVKKASITLSENAEELFRYDVSSYLPGGSGRP